MSGPSGDLASCGLAKIHFAVQVLSGDAGEQAIQDVLACLHWIDHQESVHDADLNVGVNFQARLFEQGFWDADDGAITTLLNFGLHGFTCVRIVTTLTILVRSSGVVNIGKWSDGLFAA